MPIQVVVSGAAGKMGREVLRAVHGANDMELVGAVAPSHAGMDAGELAGLGPLGVEVRADLADALRRTEATHVVDFTTPDAVFDNVVTAIDMGRRVVFGTTGLNDNQLTTIKTRAEAMNTGVLYAPNFAIGAVLMMKFAAEAAQFFERVEIIELHHDQKKDAPSGTAIKTAELVSEARRSAREVAVATTTRPVETARGDNVKGIRIHSIRLPGLVAHQEVICGLAGQTLSIRHDSIDRGSFMPGVLLALRRVDTLTGLTYGLEHLLFEQ